MKASIISKLRKKYTDKSFINSQLLKWAHKQYELAKFERFECSPFFRGETLASLNRVKYKKDSAKCWAKIEYYKKMLKIKSPTP